MRKANSMERIKKIPVIGYICRLFMAFIKLPKHLDVLYAEIRRRENSQENILELKKWNSDRMREIAALQEWNSDRTREIATLQEWNSDRMREIAALQEWNSDRAREIVTLQEWNNDRMQEIAELRQWNLERMQEIQKLQNLHLDTDYIKKLNYLCSGQPTVWGEEDRLHISELAAVDACLFNTNSGHITIGDYTFAGSRVSILAGSHDMKLTGLLRRDVELTESCDILIGNGVWLASNCVILGPAIIEDNAVIAAGAVVTPGTHVPAGAIYGGVPAKEIGRIDILEAENMASPAYRRAIRRTGGVLFRKGWTQKAGRYYSNTMYEGHILLGKTAEILVRKKEIQLFCHLENDVECTLTVEGDNLMRYQYILTKGENKIFLELEDGWNDKDICSIHLDISEEVTELFVAYIDSI